MRGRIPFAPRLCPYQTTASFSSLPPRCHAHTSGHIELGISGGLLGSCEKFFVCERQVVGLIPLRSCIEICIVLSLRMVPPAIAKVAGGMRRAQDCDLKVSFGGGFFLQLANSNRSFVHQEIFSSGVEEQGNRKLARTLRRMTCQHHLLRVANAVTIHMRATIAKATASVPAAIPSDNQSAATTTPPSSTPAQRTRADPFPLPCSGRRFIYGPG